MVIIVLRESVPEARGPGLKSLRGPIIHIVFGKWFAQRLFTAGIQGHFRIECDGGAT